jgi:anti-anti-sigma factor
MESTAPAAQIVILEPKGRLDSLTAPLFEAQIQSAFDSRPGALVLDLGAVDFVSSAGLRVLLTTAKRCRKESVKLALHSVSANVMDLLRLGGLASFFPVYPDRDAALAAVR